VRLPAVDLTYNYVQPQEEATMSDRTQPITKTLSASEARANWSQTLNQVARGKSRVIVEKSGIPVAAIVTPDDFARVIRLEAEREARFAVIDRIRDALKDVPDEELEREIPKAVAEARRQLREECEQAARPA
jgi:prevent-host-death family protein